MALDSKNPQQLARMREVESNKFNFAEQIIESHWNSKDRSVCGPFSFSKLWEIRERGDQMPKGEDAWGFLVGSLAYDATTPHAEVVAERVPQIHLNDVRRLWILARREIENKNKKGEIV